MDSEDDDTFVLIGDPLTPYEEDEPSKKKYNIADQKVKDAQGRQRFHGAFTGGFSAGYFNTVGSKEGWTPSTFVSSRDKKAGNVQQAPEDFMDPEDLGEFGIAPRQVKATEDYSTSSNLKRTVESDGIIPGMAPLADLIKPARMTIGVRLLCKLGWRDGQGVGPRKKKRQRRKHTGETKVYGCSLPTAPSAQSSSCESDTDHVTSQNVTYAPKDVNPIVFMPKDDLHGLGYSGITPTGVTRCTELLNEPRCRSGQSNKKGMHGHAFGVGALEDNDNDIYNTAPDMSKYDTVLGGPDTSGTHGWTAPTSKGGKAPTDYTDAILEGFQLLSANQQPQTIFPPPHLPVNFKPYHVFTEDEITSILAAQQIPKRFTQGWKGLDAADRREALGETPMIKSVFDLVSDKNQQHMKSCMMSPSASYMSPNSSMTTSDKMLDDQAEKNKAALLASMSNRFQSTGTEIISPTDNLKTTTIGSQTPVSQSDASISRDTTPLYRGCGMFKPFAKDQAKQDRYEKFVAASKTENKDEYEALTSHMTEWERSREKEEFGRSADLYRPMSSLMATRFTQAEYADDDKVTVNKEQGGAISEQGKAASMKMYGRLTRDIFDWHPDKLLCKRFNVPNPYPDSTVVGRPKVKRDKFSVFNFLSFPEPVTSETDNATIEQTKEQCPKSFEGKGSHRKKLGQQGKPLAILASLDLRRPSERSDFTQGSKGQDAESNIETDTRNNSKTEQDTLPDMTSSDRPPMDIFKAVFGESDEDKSSTSEDDEDTNDQKHRSLSVENDPVTSVKNVFDNFGTIHGSTLKYNNDNPFSRLFASTTDTNTMNSSRSDLANSNSRNIYTDVSPTEDTSTSCTGHHMNVSCIEDRLVLHISDTDTPNRDEQSPEDTYGPELPPGLGCSSAYVNIQTSYVKPNTKDHPKKKRRKEKEKSKHKKKGKHKKHKDKHKKKKRKEIIVIKTATSSDADSEDSSSSTSISNDRLVFQT